MVTRENKIVLDGRGMPEKQERRGINCIGGDNPEEDEVPGKERVLLWIYVRSGEVSLGRSLNNVLYLLCTVKIRAVHWEVTWRLRYCQRFVGKRKEVTRKQVEGCWLGWVKWIYTLYLYTDVIFKVIQQSLLFSHAVGITPLYYIRRFDMKIGGKTGYRKFHPRYTWNGGKKANWGCQKVFKELCKKKKKTRKTSLLFKSKQHGK